MVLAGSNSIDYEYGADGTKLRTVHKTGSTTLTTDYCGNAIYENGVLKMLLNEAGYVSFPDKKFHFYLKDHQGNTRVVTDKDGNVEETNAYYPFGGNFTSTVNTQPYKYNGKELDAKNGLNWYDYGARHYDAAIGRFTTIDPLLEDSYFVNPYTYCLNNPCTRVDPTGMKSRYNWEKHRYEDEDGNEVSWESVQREYQLDGNEIPPTRGNLDDFKSSDESNRVDAITGATPKVTFLEAEKLKSTVVSPTVPFSMWLVAKGAASTVGTTISRFLGPISMIFILKSDTEPREYVKEAQDSSKDEKHGDGGRTLKKDEEQIRDLGNSLKNAPNNKERDNIKKKIQNIRKNGERKRAGEEHSNNKKR